MKRVTKAEMQHKIVRMQEVNDKLWYALQALVNNVFPDHKVEFADPYDLRTRHQLDLYDATRPHGGIVISHFHCPGQRDMADVFYLDELRYPEYIQWATARQALELLIQVRDKLVRDDDH